MPLLVIDGPRGVGKSALIAQLSRLVPTHKVWAWDVIAAASGTKKLEAIVTDTIAALNENKLVIIENSWATAALAPELLNVQFGASALGFLGEWQFGRLAQYAGLRVMLLAPSNLLGTFRPPHENMQNERIERAVYANYADRWGWLKLSNEYNHGTLIANMHAIVSRLSPLPSRLEKYPGYCGPQDARYIFVGSDEKEELDVCSRSFLPFSGKLGTRIGEFFGDKSIRFGWAIAHKVPPARLRKAQVLLTTDQSAERWCWHHVGARDVRTLPNLRLLLGAANVEEHGNLLTDILAEMEKGDDERDNEATRRRHDERRDDEATR